MCSLILAALIMLAGSASAKERLRIPPPPPPDKVIRDIRGFFHRVADGVKGASKKTWTAIRDRFDEEEGPRSPRTAPRSKKGQPPPTPDESFAKSKEAVPYRYDDGEDFDPSVGPDPAAVRDDRLPQVNMTTREPEKSGPGVNLREELKPAESANRKPFLTPDTDPAVSPADSAPPPKETSPPKATAPSGDAVIEFARPVPGKRGLVYPPGANGSSENMVDVTGFQPGQVVRDPRTGKTFRVP
jgi:hypothetical protein